MQVLHRAFAENEMWKFVKNEWMWQCKLSRGCGPDGEVTPIKSTSSFLPPLTSIWGLPDRPVGFLSILCLMFHFRSVISVVIGYPPSFSCVLGLLFLVNFVPLESRVGSDSSSALSFFFLSVLWSRTNYCKKKWRHGFLGRSWLEPDPNTFCRVCHLLALPFWPQLERRLEPLNSLSGPQAVE